MKFKSIKEKQVVNKLIYDGKIPEHGFFEVTENIINEYMIEYETLHSIGNKKRSNNFARKLAGLTMVRLNFSRGATAKDIKAGMVYVISNPAWKEYLKIGMTIDIDTRLASYQMYDPLKQYSVENYEFVLDRRKTESNILKTFDIHIESGEWVKYENSFKIIECVRTNVWII